MIAAEFQGAENDRSERLWKSRSLEKTMKPLATAEEIELPMKTHGRHELEPGMGSVSGRPAPGRIGKGLPNVLFFKIGISGGKRISALGMPGCDEADHCTNGYA